MSWFRHAFALEDSGPFEPSAEQCRVVDRVLREVSRRSLSTPALVFLEATRPLNFLGAQTLHFFRPILSALLDARGVETFATFLEHRGSIDYLVRRLEEIEAEPGSRPDHPRTKEPDPPK